MKRILPALAVLLGFHSFAFSQALPASSLWKNQRGSTLEVFFVDPAGSFQGQFINRAAGFTCQGTPFPAVGTIKNNSIAFAVSFVPCASYATWYGLVNGNIMKTPLIILFVPPKGPPLKVHETDVFTRVR
jgi:hypothetical protein